MVGNEIPEDHLNLACKEAERRLALAASIWDASARKRKEIVKRLEDTSAAFREKFTLYGPLKVGTHFMPRVTEWNDTEGRIPFNRYLETVVGLAREDDRMRWWRAFLTAKIRRDQHADYWGRHPPAEARDDPDWSEPDSFPIDEAVIPAVLERQRSKGFSIGFSASYYLEEFRTWRLSMKSHDTCLAVAASLEECVKKGLEAERSIKSGKP
ncbi:hypothetical protein ACFQY0_03010 [Haloferula chungangensis]|uniref:Uncharacterized protein n=1 Tax=Haloferula chungangensis TaxID=1048331 RepID=A0ABW2L4P3_9BACT